MSTIADLAKELRDAPTGHPMVIASLASIFSGFDVLENLMEYR
jgi:hypothetical protein